jgi:hypothetical protein
MKIAPLQPSWTFGGGLLGAGPAKLIPLHVKTKSSPMAESNKCSVEAESHNEL